MDINVAGIKNQLNLAYQYGVEKLGILADHTVRILKQGRDFVQQDFRLAGATFFVANILFLEVAVRLASLANYLFLLALGKESDWSKNGLLFKNIILLTFVGSLITAMNVALMRQIRSTLTPLAITGIATASCASYLSFRMWLASEKA